MTLGIIGIVGILLSSASVQSKIFAAFPGEKGRFDCTYDNDKNKETCCDSANDSLKCLECDVDLQKEQKYNCKEVSPKSNDVQPGDLVKAPQNLNKPIQNFSESESES